MNMNQKSIYWQSKPGSAEVHVVSESGGGNIPLFNELLAVLRETFPQAEDQDIYFGSTQRDNQYEYPSGRAFVTWKAPVLEKDAYPDWRQAQEPRCYIQ